MRLEGVVVREFHRQVTILFLTLNPLNKTKLLQLVVFADVFKLDTALAGDTGLLILQGID